MSKGKEIRKMDASKLQTIADAIQTSIRNFTKCEADFGVQSCFALVYAAYMASLYNEDDAEKLFSIIESKTSEQRAVFVKSYAGYMINVAFHLAKEFNVNELLAYMYVCPKNYKGDYGTPESISKLALRILDVQPGDTIADFGSGVGDFLTLSSGFYAENSLYGIEINPPLYDISTIRTELFSDNTKIELGDMFALPEDVKFDKIFSNYPFGIRLSLSRKGSEYADDLHKRGNGIKKIVSSAWVFNSLILDHLTEGGKAVAIMNNATACNFFDREIREYFIKNGFIEAIIALPSKIFDFSLPTTMIVVSKGNKCVKMVDASELCEQGRRANFITDSNIDSIIKLLTEGGENAASADLTSLKNNDYVLNPLRYFEDPIDGVEFGSLIKRVTRGAPLKAGDLDKMVSMEPTNTQYLKLNGIQNGIISNDLPYLKALEPKLEKYCIKDRNLLLSKNGTPFKVAVARIEEGRKLLGNGNLYIIELDEQRVNPYFIQAFFDSDAGTAALKSIVVGDLIFNIPVEALKKLIVPLPSMRKQNEIARRYQAKLDEIRFLQLKLQDSLDELKYIFEEES